MDERSTFDWRLERSTRTVSSRNLVQLASRGWIDFIVGLLFFAIGAMISAQFIFAFGRTNFYQSFMPAIVMWACGQGLVDPTPMLPEIKRFLEMSVQSFDCGLLASVRKANDASLFFYAHAYLGLAAALCWRLLGVSYENLWPIISILYGAYTAGCFLLLRIFFSRSLAALAGALLTVSPVAISMLVNLRDFAKAPFTIWGLVLLVLIIREHRSQKLFLKVAMAGALVGIGSGFRTDVMVIFLVGLPVIALGLNRDILSLTTRVVAVFLFVAISFLFALPTLKGTEGAIGFVALQGVTEPFRHHLGISAVPYELGHRYLDAVNLITIVADLRRKDPLAWVSQETKKVDPVAGVEGPTEFTSQAFTKVDSYVLTWMPIFIGDVATRALKSMAWIVGYYGLFTPEQARRDPYQMDFPANSLVANATRPFIIGLGMIGFLCFAFRNFSRSPREGLWVIFIFAAVMAVPSIQFSLRHLFHLEVIYWLGLLSFVSLTVELPRVRRLIRFASWVVLFSATIAIVYCILLFVQDHLLKREITKILRAPRESVARTSVPLPGDRILFEISVPPQYQEIVSSPLNFLVHSAADRLLISVGGWNCPQGKFQLGLTYAKEARFNHTITVDVPPDERDRGLVVVPAFYTSREFFGGIVVPNDRAPCITEVSRLSHTSRLPSIFAAVLSPNWESKRLFQLPGGF